MNCTKLLLLSGNFLRPRRLLLGRGQSGAVLQECNDTATPKAADFLAY